MAARRKTGRASVPVEAKRRAAKKPLRKRDDTFVAFVIEQLDRLGSVRSKSMFGGHGLYSGETFFAVIDEGRLYFKVGDATRPRYKARGMGPFAYAPGMVMKGYHEVPLEVIEDASELVRWAREACGVAREKAASKRPATRSQ